MPHFHNFNPWSATLVYVPSIAEAIGKDYERSVFSQYGERVDAYILPSRIGNHSFGVRYGSRPEDYLSPLIQPEIAVTLIAKYT